MLNALSFDIEDYYQVGAFAKNIAISDWDKYESRVEDNTRKLLNLLSSQKIPVRATFFVLGWIAERHPNLVPEIAADGHEIASHGYGHQLVYTLTEEEFRSDVRKTREILRKQSGQEVIGYRAPSFSIVNRTYWAHRILVEEGYRYDSSVFPIHHDLHGNADAPREIHWIDTAAGQILEFPPGVVRRFGQNIPVSGGGYFRFFPYFLTVHWLRCINKAGNPFVFYMHPWEVDPEQPRIANISFKSRFRHYLNLNKTLKRLECLVNDFQFAPVSEVIRTY